MPTAKVSTSAKATHTREVREVDSLQNTKPKSFEATFTKKVQEVDSFQDAKSKLLEEKFAAMTVKELRSLCRQNCVPVSGLKAQLVERLTKATGAEGGDG